MISALKNIHCYCKPLILKKLHWVSIFNKSCLKRILKLKKIIVSSVITEFKHVQYIPGLHQHFTSSFFVRKSFEQLFCTYGVDLYFFGERKLAQKQHVKCWWNLLQVCTAPDCGLLLLHIQGVGPSCLLWRSCYGPHHPYQHSSGKVV